MKKRRKCNYLKKIISMMLILAMVTVMAGGFGAQSVHAETVEGEEVTVTLTRSTATNMYINIQNRITWDNPNSINRKYSFSTRIRMLGGSVPTSTVITQSSFQSGDSGSWEFEAADSYRFVYRGYLYGDEVIPQGSSKTYIVDWTRRLTRPSQPFTYRGTVYSEKERRDISWSNTYQPCILRYDYTLFLKANDGTKIPLLTSYAYQTYLEYTQNFDITRLGLSEDTRDAPYSLGYPCIAIGWINFEANNFRWSNVRPTTLMGGTNNRITDGISDPEGIHIGYAVNETRTDYATRQVGNATLATERTVTVESASPVYYSPIVDDKSSDLIASVGDDAKWTEGVEATWGKTTVNKITSTSTATTEGGGDGMGTIVDDIILANGTDEDLANADGTKFDKIGVKEHTYTIRDAHSLSDSAPYDGDNTSATTKRNIIVKTDASPALEAYYEGTSVPYGGEWLSQYVPANSEEAPDTDHYRKVDLKASGSGIAGTYDTVIWKGASGSGTEVERGTDTNTATYTFGAPGDETSADGQTFYANLQEVYKGTNATNAGLTALSGNSAEKSIKIDSTPPTTDVDVTVDTNGLYVGLNDKSKDTLSGIYKTYVAFVEEGGDAPTITNGTWTEIGNVAEGTTYQAGKTYDIYAYSMDNATNKSAAKLLGSGVRTPVTSVIVKKTADKDKVKLGDEITYTITVKNTGEVPVNDWKVTDTLGEGLTYVFDDSGGTNSGQVTDWIVSLDAGATKEIKLVAGVTNKDGAIKNGVEIRGNEPDDPNTEEDESIEDEDESESTLQFDVTFVDEDGTTVLKEKTAYDYKTKAADIGKPADPKKEATDKYVYVFKGWEPKVSDVTEDVVYKATYEEKKKYFAFYDKDENSPVNPKDPLEVGEDDPKIGDIITGDDGEEYNIIEIGELDPNTCEIPIKAGKLFTLTFNLEGGELNGETEAVKMKELKNETINILGEPTRAGYKFEYWQGSKYYPGDEYKVEGHHTFTAIWTKIPDEREESSENPGGDDKEPENTEPENTEPGENTEPENTKPRENTEPENTKPGENTEPENTKPRENTEPENTKPGNTNSDEEGKPENTTEPAEKPDAENKNDSAESKKPTAAPTGDESNAMIWIALLGLAAIGALLMKKLKAIGE